MSTTLPIELDRASSEPLYYRQNVDLHSARAGNFVGNPTQAGPTWNAVDWFVKQ